MTNIFNLDDIEQKKALLGKLKKTIQSSNLNFLLGSGCSLPAIQSLGSIEIDYQKRVDDDKLEDANKLLFDFIKPFLLEPKEWKDYQNKDIKTTSENYKLFLETIIHLLSERKNDLLQKRATVFTTNYDLFIESAFEEVSTHSNLIDGFKRSPSLTSHYKFSSTEFFNTIYNNGNLYNYRVEIPSINLIKLHGSINWQVSKNEIIHSINQLGELKAKHDNLSQSGDTKAIKEFNKEIPVVLPRKEKFKDTVLDQNYYDLLRLYSNELDKEGSLLLVDGFSFADEHILDITIRALRNPTLLLVLFCFSKTDKDNFNKIFSSFKNVDIVYFETKNLPFDIFSKTIRELLK